MAVVSSGGGVARRKLTTTTADGSATSRLPRNFTRTLDRFSTGDYDAGRPMSWRVAWFVVQNLIFDRWWLPARARPPILRLFGADVGDGCVIRHGVRVHWPWNLTLGNDIWVGEFAWLHTLVRITVEDDVCISQRANVVTGSHQHRDPAFAYDNAPVVLQHGSWIGTGAIVLRGVNVGRNSIVGAGAVVYEDVPDHTAITADGATRPL
jgi:putative colanic acid biosynthesis acetyltransferase WcaF